MNKNISISGIDPADGAGMRIDVDNGLICAVHDEEKPDSGYLSAGLVDLQVNGYGGFDFNVKGFDADLVLAVCQKLAGLGVTRFLPTLITASEADIICALKTITRRAAPTRSPMCVRRQLMNFSAGNRRHKAR